MLRTGDFVENTVCHLLLPVPYYHLFLADSILRRMKPQVGTHCYLCYRSRTGF